jgi:transposase
MSKINVNDGSMPALLENVAGIDIGSKSHFVALPPGETKNGNVHEFPAHSIGLAKMAEFLKARNVSRVAMEATGIYWVPAYNCLQKEGIDVCVVNPRQMKHPPGRKSDVLDCQWIQQLFACGLLSPSHIPDDEIVVLREYVRAKARLVQDCARCVNRMDKALRLMNIQLDQAVTDIAGVTGMAIIEAILDGERDAAKLAGTRDARCAKSSLEMIPYLTGVYSDAHVFNLRLAHDLHAHLLDSISLANGMIYDKLVELAIEPAGLDGDGDAPEPAGHDADPAPKPLSQIIHGYSKVDLTKIEGIGVGTALVITSEFGNNLRRFPSASHFASFLGLCPACDISGGKTLSRKTKKVTHRVATALRLAANSLRRSKSHLGVKLRHWIARKGPQKAITAMANKLARIVYALMAKGEEYVRSSNQAEEEKARQRQVRALKSKAAALGLTVTESPAAGPDASEAAAADPAAADPVAAESTAAKSAAADPAAAGQGKKKPLKTRLARRKADEAAAKAKAKPKPGKGAKGAASRKNGANIVSPGLVLLRLMKKGVI